MKLSIDKKLGRQFGVVYVWWHIDVGLWCHFIHQFTQRKEGRYKKNRQRNHQERLSGFIHKRLFSEHYQHWSIGILVGRNYFGGTKIRDAKL